MNIMFSQVPAGRKLSSSTYYLVIAKLAKRNFLTYAILNNSGYLSIVSVLEGDVDIFDSQYNLDGSCSFKSEVVESEPNIKPKLDGLFNSEIDYYIDSILKQECWAIAHFAFQLVSKGLELNAYYHQIYQSDQSKIEYVKGEMNGLFMGVCNFLGGCRDIQFKFRFDSHEKTAISRDELFYQSYNKYLVDLSEVETEVIENWEEDALNCLYEFLTVSSSLNEFAGSENINNDKSADRSCLKLGIRRIVFTIKSLFLEREVKVHKLSYCSKSSPLFTYALIFDSRSTYYRFQLENTD